MNRRPHSQRAGSHTGVSFDLGPDARISGLDDPGAAHGPEAAHSEHAVSQANFVVCHQLDRLRPRAADQGDD